MDKETQLRRHDKGPCREVGVLKKSTTEAIAAVRKNPRTPYDLRVCDRAEGAINSGALSSRDRRDLESLLLSKYGRRIGFDADELSEREEEEVFPAVVLSYMAGVCEYVGSDFHPEYKNLILTIGDALRDHSVLSKLTLEELIHCKRDLALLPREDLPVAYNNRLDPPEFISLLEKWWHKVRASRLGKIEAKLRDDFKTSEDLAEEASFRELEDRQIRAAQSSVNSPTLSRHLSGKAKLEECWASLVKLYREDESFRTTYVRRIRSIFLDDLDRVSGYVDECFPRLPRKIEERAADLAFEELRIGEEKPRYTPELLDRISKVASRIRLAFFIFRWLEDGFDKLPPEPTIFD